MQGKGIVNSNSVLYLNASTRTGKQDFTVSKRYNHVNGWWWTGDKPPEQNTGGW